MGVTAGRERAAAASQETAMSNLNSARIIRALRTVAANVALAAAAGGTDGLIIWLLNR
jgi:hypothetical protein